MRVHVASILALLILTIACADPWCCSDGCERGGMAATHSTQTGADCPTCLGAVVPHQDAPLVRTERATCLSEIAESTTISTYQTDVDHPPRLV